jgi:hypothetical protein
MIQPLPFSNALHIDPDVYYFIPTIFDTYKLEYDGAKHIKEWSDFVVAKQLGVAPYVSQHAKLDVFDKDSLISDYYRIVDLKQFLVTSLQLGVTIDEETPTIPKTIAGVVPFPRGNLVQ